jgi:hypothetical protein
MMVSASLTWEFIFCRGCVSRARLLTEVVKGLSTLHLEFNTRYRHGGFFSDACVFVTDLVIPVKQHEVSQLILHATITDMIVVQSTRKRSREKHELKITSKTVIYARNKPGILGRAKDTEPQKQELNSIV